MSNGGWWLLAAAISLLWSTGSQAQTAATASTLKAAFIYNFAKFTVWPPEVLVPGQRLVFCVIGDDGVTEALEQTVRGRMADGHELAVQAMKPDGVAGACHVLYASGLDSKRWAQLAVALRGTSVFTVGDGDSIGQWSAVAHLIQENDRMRFTINAAAADRARLQLSSKLLSLATILTEPSRAEQ